jgi:hypothetical protein
VEVNGKGMTERCVGRWNSIPGPVLLLSLSPPVPCPRLLLPPLKREREREREASRDGGQRERTRLGESILYRPGQATG